MDMNVLVIYVINASLFCPFQNEFWCVFGLIVLLERPLF